MRVLVTGGSGFLGRGILRRADKLGWDITVYSRDEYKQDLCRRVYPNARYVLGDIQNYDRLMHVLPGHDTVIHTAAIKYIPEAEHNVLETIAVNVTGSNTVFKACQDSGIQAVCSISTDKVVQPVNVYGMTKAIVERMVGEYAKYNNRTKFVACRYGNVVGSTGSVAPLFEYQAKTMNKITVTDPEMTRYWISIDDAVDLIVESLNNSTGTVTIPSPASMRIGDLANLIAEQYDAKVEIVGVRPGEKKHEQLLHQQESVRTSWDSKYYTLWPVGTEVKNSKEAFMLSSNSPHVWLHPKTMMNMIEDAKYV